MCKSILLNDRPEKFDGEWLSVSKVKTFKDCQLKFRYAYIEKLPRKTWDFHIYGKFAHAILEYFHKAIIDGDTRPHNKVMTDAFNQACLEYKSQLFPGQKKEIWTMMFAYLQLLAKHKVNVVGVEDNFYIDIDGKVLLNGFIDRVQIDDDGVLHVADYKTSKSKSFLKNDFMQLKTYAFVKCLEDPKLEKIRTSYIMLRHKFEFITKEYDRAEIMKMEKDFLKYADEIQQEKLFRSSTSKLCEYCDYLEVCEDGKRSLGLSKVYGKVDW